MACSFALGRFVHVYLLVSVVVSTLKSYAGADTEYLLRNSSLWAKKKRTKIVESDDGKSGIGWFSPAANIAASCDLGTKNWFYLKKIKTDANRIYLKVDYHIHGKFCNRSDCGLFLQHYHETLNFSIEDIQTDKFVAETIGRTVRPRRMRTIGFNIKSSSQMKYVAIAFQAKGVCVKVYNISMYYHYCPRDTSTSVILERTPAPSSGVKQVNGYCSDTSSNTKGSALLASCSSDGNWKDFSPQPNVCKCSAGYEFDNNTVHCIACKANFYKKPEDEGSCKPCPKNSVTSGVGSTSCVCIADHYKNNVDEECRKIPPQPNNLNYTVLETNQIRLHWDMATKHKKIYYQVKCEQHDRMENLVPCVKLTMYKKGLNITQKNLTVGGLMTNTHYTFRVTSLNDVSGQAGESEWNFAKITIKLPDATTRHTNVITTQQPPTPTTEGFTTTILGLTSEAPFAKPPSKSANKAEGPMSLGPMIGGAIGGLLVIMVFVIAIIVCRRKRSKKERLITEDVDMSTIEKSYIDPTKYGSPETAVKKFAKEIDRRKIKLEGALGEGEFARVHKGQLCRSNEPTIDVAVKVLKPGSTGKNREDFLTEAAVMAQFKDMNIVALEGVVTISHPVMIITEFMHNGALSTFLAENKNNFGEIQLLMMARGIASGMKYLSRMRFVHRDLAARNVLVNENFVCKVADFGLTRELEESCQGEYVTQGGKIPIRWTAPEAYKHRRFTTASDVWSFGIVLWEIMSYADRPYGNWDNYMVMDRVNQNYRLTPPTNCPKIVHQLMTECWKSDRTQRPCFADIVEMLERWIKNPYLLKDYEYVTEKTRMADRKSCVAKSIREYLEAIKMERYVDNFIDFGYTELYQLSHLKDGDLVLIGIPLVGHRNKIMKAMSLPREKERLLPATV